MMISAPEATLRGSSTMFLAGTVLDMGASDNIINTTFAHLISLMEQRVRATILLGNGGEITCQAACRHVPLRFDNEYPPVITFEATSINSSSYPLPPNTQE
jgi:hypothetical protein